MSITQFKTIEKIDNIIEKIDNYLNTNYINSFMGFIEKVLSSKSKIRILRIFYDNSAREFSLVELTGILKTSTGTIHPSLISLVNSRILNSKKVGISTLYRLNYENPLVRKLLEIFDAELNLLINKAKEFTRKLDKKYILSIILFGSVARRQITELSDIDMLIVYKKNERKVRDKISHLSEKFLDENILISPVILSDSEAKNMLKRYDSFILTVQNEGIVLFGKKLEEL